MPETVNDKPYFKKDNLSIWFANRWHVGNDKNKSTNVCSAYFDSDVSCAHQIDRTSYIGHFYSEPQKVFMAGGSWLCLKPF